MRTLYTGNDSKIAVRLTQTIDAKKGPKNLAIDPSKLVKVLLVNASCTESYMDAPITVSPGTPGSDWDNGLIIILFPGAATAGITFQGHANIEIKVTMEEGVEDLSGHLPVIILKGLI